MHIKRCLACLVCFQLLTTAIYAESASKSDTSELIVIDAYMPEVPPVSRTAAVYLKLKNTSTSPFILIGASTSIANHVMIHQTIETQDTVKMKHQSSVVIQAGETLELEPGGTHIMLMGLQKQAIPEKFEMNLMFENNATQPIQVNVRSRVNN